jgi:hypothetical protein
VQLGWELLWSSGPPVRRLRPLGGPSLKNESSFIQAVTFWKFGLSSRTLGHAGPLALGI